MQEEAVQSCKEILHVSAVKEILGGFAHEVSQPLNAIMIASQVIQIKVERSALPQTEKSFLTQRLAMVSSQVERATHIVDELRQFADGRTNYDGPVDLLRVYQRVQGFMDQQFMGRGIELRMKAVQDLPVLRTDSRSVEAVLVHCLAFARDSLDAIGQWHDGRDIAFRKLASVRLFTNSGMSVLSVEWAVGNLPDSEISIDQESRIGLVTARSFLRSGGGDLQVSHASVITAIP